MEQTDHLFGWNPDYDDDFLCITEEYGALTCREAREVSCKLNMCMRPRSLLIILCENTAGSLVTYLTAIRNRHVPILLDASVSPDMLRQIIKAYVPDYIVLPAENQLSDQLKMHFLMSVYDSGVFETGLHSDLYMHPDLALLLSTSGSTGSPKMIRQSYRNLLSNAQAIAEYLDIGKADRPITTLPMNYTYGLSIIHSHLLVGATILLTRHSILEGQFWHFFTENQATTFGGVPFTYEMLDRLRFRKMHLPSLKVMTQAGGHLDTELQLRFADYAAQTGRKMIVMYGQTEATARMAYLPWENAAIKAGSIGIAIPGGRFELTGDHGQVIREPGINGELVYYGPNVTMGYAGSREDLQKEDEWKGRLETGDIAFRDADGYYYISGRKKRFVKPEGKRISLDEVEKLLAGRYPGINFACTGDDHYIDVYIEDPSGKREDFSLDTGIGMYLQDELNIFHSHFRVQKISEIPRNGAGKILYQKLGKKL